MAPSDLLTPDLTPLVPELAERLVSCGPFMGLKHPLVFSVPYIPHGGLNRHLNECLVQKKAALELARAEGNWDSFLWLHERAYRFNALMEVQDLMSDEEYWEAVGMVYTDSENFSEIPDGPALLASPRPGRDAIMRDYEREAFAALPERIKIFKGYQKRTGWDCDWSFSTSQKVAEWFARRFDLPGKRLLVAECRKEDVVAYFLRRNEFEILLDPAKVIAPLEQPLRDARRKPNDYQALIGQLVQAMNS